jgi:hypothetical protein
MHVAVGAPSTELGMKPVEHVAVQVSPTRVGRHEYVPPVGLIGWGVEQAATGARGQVWGRRMCRYVRHVGVRESA